MHATEIAKGNHPMHVIESTALLASTGDASSGIRFCFTCQHLQQALAMLIAESLLLHGVLTEVLAECSRSKSITMHDEGILFCMPVA